MLVDDKLAKEKLARICDQMAKDIRCDVDLNCGECTCGDNEKQLAQLIRNTDLTDCQPGIRVDNGLPNEWIAPAPIKAQNHKRQKAMNEHSSGTRATVPPSLGDSGTTARIAFDDWWTKFGRHGNKNTRREVTAWLGFREGYKVAAPDQGSVRNATDTPPDCLADEVDPCVGYLEMKEKAEAMRERCARVALDAAEQWRKDSRDMQEEGVPDPQWLHMNALASGAEIVWGRIRALPDQKD